MAEKVCSDRWHDRRRRSSGSISVVYLYVSDMERSAAFYRDLLGIPLEGDDDWAGGHRSAARASRSTTRTRGSASSRSGTMHVNLEVEDVDAAAERLRAAGVDVDETMREDVGRRGARSSIPTATSSTSSSPR